MMKPKSVGLGDKNLREAVEQQLDYDPAVQSKNVGVSVSEGVVSLSGYFETYADKIIAEKAAKRVRGVKAMANDIEVRPALPASSVISVNLSSTFQRGSAEARIRVHSPRSPLRERPPATRANS
jgi:hypothetical protein